MKQYQRMVSYLYEYKQGVKGVNVGYVRIEQRGGICRITLQMRGRNLRQLPDLAVFRQGEQGVQVYSLCPLTERNGEYKCRIDTEVDNLAGSGIALPEVDGILLYQDASYYVATNWKNAGIYFGEIQAWNPGQAAPNPEMLSELPEPESESGAEVTAEPQTEPEPKENPESESGFAAEPQTEPEPKESPESESGFATEPQMEPKPQTEPDPVKETTSQHSLPEQEDATLHTMEQKRNAMEQRESALKAVCRNCPFKRNERDYGKRILAAFPSMRPFPNDAGLACVRIEPQDLGCLPMQLWHLANNPFLMQGYYGYRHLIFMETEKHQYALGVPGIYGEQNRRQAKRYGFLQFRSLCMGSYCAGAFGYWLMPLAL